MRIILIFLLFCWVSSSHAQTRFTKSSTQVNWPIQILTSQGGIIIKSAVSGMSTIEVMTTTGQSLQTFQLSLTVGENFVPLALVPGPYLIRVNINRAGYIEQINFK